MVMLLMWLWTVISHRNYIMIKSTLSIQYNTREKITFLSVEGRVVSHVVLPTGSFVADNFYFFPYQMLPESMLVILGRCLCF